MSQRKKSRIRLVMVLVGLLLLMVALVLVFEGREAQSDLQGQYDRRDALKR